MPPVPRCCTVVVAAVVSAVAVAAVDNALTANAAN